MVGTARRRRSVPVLAVAILLVVVCGGSALIAKAATHTPVAVRTIGYPDGRPCPTPGLPPLNGDLTRSVLSAPPGYQADPDSDDGVLDLDQVSSIDGYSSRDRSVLEKGQFVGGARQTFLDPPTGISLDARVYQFACPQAADRYLTDQQGYELNTINPIQAPVPGVPGGTAFASKGPAENGFFLQSAAASVDGFYVGVYLASPTSRSTTYAGVVLTAAVNRLTAWYRGVSSLVTAPAPGAAVAAPVGPGQAPVCPPAPGPPTRASFLASYPADPAGFDPFPLSDPPNGPVTAAQLTQGDPGALDELANDRAFGLAGGFNRAWEREAGGQLQVTLLHFTCAAGAVRFAHDHAAAGPGYKSFPVTDGIGGAFGELSTTLDDQGHYPQQLAAAVGDTFVSVTYFSPSTGTAEIQSLAVPFVKAAGGGHLPANPDGPGSDKVGGLAVALR